MYYCFLLFLLGGCHAARQNQVGEYQAVQVILKEGDSLSIRKLKEVWAVHSTRGNLYRWRDRFIFYAEQKHVVNFYDQVKEQLPSVKRTLFSVPFYVFDRQNCETASLKEEESEHILLSANLVQDTNMQKDYLDYHRKQFEEWPEVSKGFCNAEFKQILLFKEGQQLLLVIDIPKGADFEDLNKKTVEHNPRVAEWNRLMSAYQEGLPGTETGEVWVRFERMDTGIK